MNNKVLFRFRRDERGQGLIEFGLVFLFLFALVISILEMCLFLYNYSVLTDAAKDGVRCAIVHCSDGVQAKVNNILRASIFGASTTPIIEIVPVDYTNAPPGSQVQVTVRYQYQPLSLGQLNWAPTGINISATSVGRIQF